MLKSIINQQFANFLKSISNAWSLSENIEEQLYIRAISYVLYKNNILL